MVEIAKRVGQLLTLIVFEGESVSHVCLLQELHSCLTLSCIAIHTPETAKVGVKNRVYCCPICVHVVKNDLIFLNHIIVGHYWGSFSCGKCLAFVVATAQEMKRHIAGCGKPQMGCSKACSMHSEVHCGSNPAAGPGRPRREQREGLVWRHRRGRAVHHQSPSQWSRPRSRLRSTRSQCSPMCTNSVWYAILSGCIWCVL